MKAIVLGMGETWLILLVIAHLQAVALAWGLALLTARRLRRLGRRLPPGGRGRLILGFICFGLAAMAECLDHIGSGWQVINGLSLWNGVFFTTLASALALLAGAVRSGWRVQGLLLALVIGSSLGYATIGRAAAIAGQVALLLVMLPLWWQAFRDRRLWLYPLFTVGMTSVFGALLRSSGNQIWHLFIGPAGSLSLVLLWLILLRADQQAAASGGAA